MRNRASRRWIGPSRCCHDYVRHGTTGLFAAFNIVDGTVISQLRRHHRAAEFGKFLVQIDKAVPRPAYTDDDGGIGDCFRTGRYSC